MNKKNKLVTAAIFIVGMIGAGLYFSLPHNTPPDKNIASLKEETFGWKFPVTKFPLTGFNSKLIAYSDIRDPGGIPQGLPVRLKIPSIGVDSAIEDALITADGRMDVPFGSVNVAWFALGPHPGKPGSAVIGGHFGKKNGVPFVFYKLDQMKIGDKVYIVDDKSDTLAFTVRSIKLFDRDADATLVFTSNDGIAHLNLITCEGVWNKVNDTYPDRRVVFTDAIPLENATEAFLSFPRFLSVGSKGPDVVNLQTTLEQKGFLTMPLGVSKGFFGSLTRIALAKYQTSIGLSPVGVFGPLTRARFISDSTAIAVKPALPKTSISTKESPTSLGFFRQTIGSLYATPFDGLITSSLFVSIVFVAFKITRRRKK